MVYDAARRVNATKNKSRTCARRPVVRTHVTAHADGVRNGFSFFENGFKRRRNMARVHAVRSVIIRHATEPKFTRADPVLTPHASASRTRDDDVINDVTCTPQCNVESSASEGPKCAANEYWKNRKAVWRKKQTSEWNFKFLRHIRNSNWTDPRKNTSFVEIRTCPSTAVATLSRHELSLITVFTLSIWNTDFSSRRRF